MIDYIIDSLDNKLIYVLIFLDLAKAFNTINHKILLKKLAKYGIRGEPLHLIKSYLMTRTQCNLVNYCESNSRTINVGVSQGSSLGPLLILLYIILMICPYLQLKVRLFADDTCLSYEHTDPYTLNNIVKAIG